MKEFFKPTLRKLLWTAVVFVVLSGISFIVLPWLGVSTFNVLRYGLPWYWLTGGINFTLIACPPGGGCGRTWTFDAIALFADFAVSYLIVCAIVTLRTRAKKTHATPPRTN